MKTKFLNDGDQESLVAGNSLIINGSLIVIAEACSKETGEILYRKVLFECNKGDIVPFIEVEENTFIYIRALSNLEIREYEFKSESEYINCNNKILDKLQQSHAYIIKNKIDYSNVKNNLIGLIKLILKYETEFQNSKFTTYSDNNSYSALLESLESTQSYSNYTDSVNNDNFTKISKCLCYLSGESKLIDIENNSKYDPSNSDNFIDLCNKYSLIPREIELSNDLFRNDCGDLILFLDNEESPPIAMKSFSQGYYILDPTASDIPFRIYDINDIKIQFSIHAYAIYPSFKKKDLTSLGLLRFSYGDPVDTQKYILSGLLGGLLIGFILSIGKDVGASRWIFGMGLSGLFLGTTFGFLTGGFRVAVFMMFSSTILGLLVPTFNTLITNYALPERDFNILLQLSFILIFSGIVRISLEWTQNRFLQISQQKGSFKAQIASINRLLSLPIKFFKKYTFGDLQLRFFSIDELREEIKTLLEGGLIRAALTSIYILFMLRISVKLTFLAFIISLILIIPTVLIGLQSRPIERKQQEIEGEAQSKNLELINSVSKLRLSGAEYDASRWWAQSFKRIINLEIILDAKESVSQILQSIVPNLGNLLLYIVITKLGSEALLKSSINSPNIGQLLGFFAAFGTFIGAMVSLSDLIIEAFDLPIIFERARPILEERTENDENLFEPGLLNGNIQIKNLRYQYQLNSPFVLDNLDLSIKTGQLVALTGPTGCGKSTLVRLLLGFDKASEGNIYFDGKNLNGLRKDLIRKQIGTVTQNATVFAGTIFECIAGGRVITLEQAWEAVSMVSLSEEINQMPMGMFTVIPEGGATLSGGQRQRLSIARALIGKPKILIFDEATSALDNPTQEIITKSLEDLKVTRIVIAHRLTTIKNADHIFVINNGKVEEEGDYQSLIKNNGLFHKLVKRQIA